MNALGRRTVLALAIPYLLGVLGCTNNRSQSIESIGSVDQAGKTNQFIVVGLSDGGRVYMVMAVADCTNPKTTINLASTTSQGEIVFSNNRKMNWSCASPDTHTGTVTIDQRNFDLAKGAVFLVWLKDGKLEVKQLAADISKIQSSKVAKQLEALGDTEPAIVEFFELARKTK